MWSDTITNVIFGVIATVSACISIWQAHRYFHGLVGSEPAANHNNVAHEILSCTHCPSYHNELSQSRSDVSTLVESTRQTTAEQDSSLDLKPESLAFTSQETFQTEIGDGLSELKVEWGTASLDPDWRSWSLLHPSGAHGEGSDDVKTTLANFCDHLFHKSATFHRLSLPPLPEAYPDNIMLRGESSTGWPSSIRPHV